jgi:amino-acid N-acetyltransferase
MTGPAAGDRIRSADPSDFPSLAHLLQESSLPIAGLPADLAHFFVAEQGGTMIAAAGLEVFGKSALLRSVVVDPHHRGTGIGQQLVSKALDHTRELRLEEVFLLTATAQNWFPRFGFEPSERSVVPEPMRRSAEFTGACPATAVLMRLQLEAS